MQFDPIDPERGEDSVWRIVAPRVFASVIGPNLSLVSMFLQVAGREGPSLLSAFAGGNHE